MFSLNNTKIIFEHAKAATAIVVVVSCFSVGANTLPVPSALYTIDDLVGEFRRPLQTKVEDLRKNYRSQTTNNLVEYTSNKTVNCLFREWEPGAVLTRLEYIFRKEGEQALDVIRYKGCGADLTLVEKFLRVDPNATRLGFGQFSRGQLSFELKKEWSRYNYTLENQKGEVLFSLAGRWLDQAKTSSLYSFSIRNQEFLIVRYTKTSEETRVTYTFKGFDISYSYPPFYKNSVSQEHNQFTFKVLVKKSRPEAPIFLSSFDNQLSQNTFLSYFFYWAIRNGLNHVKGFVDFHLYWFPPTEVVSSGGLSQRLINELRLALNRILNNTNLNLVEVYVRNLIKSVEDGLIIDRRPQE